MSTCLNLEEYVKVTEQHSKDVEEDLIKANKEIGYLRQQNKRLRRELFETQSKHKRLSDDPRYIALCLELQEDQYGGCVLARQHAGKHLTALTPEGRIRIKRETGRDVNKQGLEDDQPRETVDSDRNMKNMLRQYLVPGGKLCNISDFKLTDGFKAGHRDIFEKILTNSKKLEKPPKFIKMFVQVDSQLKIFTKPSYTMDCY